MTRVSDLSTVETPALSNVVPVSDGVLTKKATLANIKNIILPPATSNILGGIKVGTGLTITTTGVLSVTDFQAYSLPVATSDRLGGIRIGTGLSVDNTGILNLNYTLPTASANTLGGVKIGDGLISNDGVLSVVFPDTSQLNENGLTVGANDEIRLYVDVQTPTLKEDYRGVLNFSIKDTSITGDYAKVRIVKSQDAELLGGDNAPALYPIGENKSINLGLPSYKWGKVYADSFVGGTFTGTFTGSSSQSDTLKVGINYRSGSITATPDTIAARDSAGNINATSFTGNLIGNANTATNSTYASNAGLLLADGVYRSASSSPVFDTIVLRDGLANINANVFNGVSTTARYADLAEKYDSDFAYDTGTVVVFGGEKEITTSSMYADIRVAGVISEFPAYIMNSESTGLLVALRGKVPVKVKGLVKKGDLLVTSDKSGYAETAKNNFSANAVFAKSLEDKLNEEFGTVMAVII